MNRLRILYISLLLVALIAGGLPVTESLAKWSRNSAVSQHRKHRRHSRAWWRRHRALARTRRERAEQRRRQRLAAASQTAAPPAQALGTGATAANNTSLLSFNRGVAAAQPGARAARLPFDFTPPHTWIPARKSPSGAAVFSVQTPDGRPAGTAVVAPVSLSSADLAGSSVMAKSRSVGGVPVTALRRTVIDRMVAEGGWVTNDMVQEMRGRRVFVVLAQTGAPGAPAQSWTFYFTELDGRVYSLATTTPIEFAAPVAAGSEQFMASLRAAGDANMAAQK
jgi:hypothetical protein